MDERERKRAEQKDQETERERVRVERMAEKLRSMGVSEREIKSISEN